jgi:hypothetical protein
MKILLRAIVILTIVFVCLNIYNLFNGYNFSILSQENIEGNSLFISKTEIPGLKELKELYISKINYYNSKAEKNQNSWLWISFLATALTAGAALVSSIGLSKSSFQFSNNKAIIIAILTFLATLANWGSTQLSNTKTEVLKKATKIIEHRSNFYVEFQKANDDAQKKYVVDKFTEELRVL